MSYTHKVQGWNAKQEWNKLHESGLFVMSIAVHNEKTKEEQSYHSSPRSWNTYLSASDSCRFYRDGKSEIYTEKSKAVDLVFDKGQSLFDELPWNGEVTLFHTQIQDYQLHKDIRSFKVGDDYEHSWDRERWEYYDFEFMRSKIEYIAREFHELLKKHL